MGGEGIGGGGPKVGERGALVRLLPAMERFAPVPRLLLKFENKNVLHYKNNIVIPKNDEYFVKIYEVILNISTCS
jgi:hypothetical protein